MSKTVKIILVVAVLGIIILVCLCLLLGGVITLRTFLSTSTPKAAPTLIYPTAAPVTEAPPTVVPPTVELMPPASTPTPSRPAPLAPEAGFTLDGVDLNVFSVRYTLMNGSEDGFHYLTGDDEFLLLVTLDSNEKDLGFMYDKYIDSVRLVDTVSGESFEADWMSWSLDDSPTNSGYVKISFPVKRVPENAAVYFTDELGVDLTPLLPDPVVIEDPWLETSKKFDVYGMDLRVQSASLQSNYTSPDGARFEKKDSANKILIVRLVSSFEDLSGLSDWYPILANPNDELNPYYVGYSSWTTGSETGQGDIEVSFEVPTDMKTFILYVPYENLIDLTSIVKKK